MSRLLLKLALLMAFFINPGIFAVAQGGSGAAGASGGGGGGGGGGGQNLYGFRYILIPGYQIKPPKKDSLAGYYSYPGNKYYINYTFDGFRYGLVEKIFHGFMRTFLNIKGLNIVMADSVHGTGQTTSIRHDAPRRILYYTVKRHVLQIAILSRTQNTCMIEVWPPHRKFQRDSSYNNNSTVIQNVPDSMLYNHDEISADTFYIIPSWTNTGTTPRHQSFNMLFKTAYLVPATIPIVYTPWNHQWQANFLSAGMAGGMAYGRTKFYRDNIMPPRNFYFGSGFIFGISSITIDSALVSKTAIKAQLGKSSLSFPGVYTGGHVAISFNSIQLMGVAGLQWVFGDYHSYYVNQHKLFIGIGIGLSIFNLLIPSSAANTGSGH